MLKIICAICLMPGLVWPCVFRTEDGRLVTPKYTFFGSEIWTEAQKEAKLSVATGTDTYSVSDFIPYACADQPIIDDINSEGKLYPTKTKAQAEFDKRKTEKFNIEEASKLEAKVGQIVDYGQSNSINVIFTTKTYEPKLKLYKERSK